MREDGVLGGLAEVEAVRENRWICGLCGLGFCFGLKARAQG